MDSTVWLDPIARLLGPWAAGLGAGAVVLRMALSFLFGGIVGCERANKRHSAGLRTFILVSIASTAAMLADIWFMSSLGARFPAVSAATVLGIAVISTCSILYSSKSQIKGLTTSVALWSCSIIGLALGGGLYTAALVGYAALLLCLFRLPALEAYLKDRSNHFEIHLELRDRRFLQDFITTLRELGIRIDDIESNPAYLHSGLSVYSVSLTITRAELKKYKKHDEIIDALRTLAYIYYIEELR